MVLDCDRLWTNITHDGTPGVLIGGETPPRNFSDRWSKPGSLGKEMAEDRRNTPEQGMMSETKPPAQALMRPLKVHQCM